MDAHDTHCCIYHGCKYSSSETCPIANGSRKQQYLCEQCGLETEGYYGEPERTEAEQNKFINDLFEKKNSKKLTINEFVRNMEE